MTIHIVMTQNKTTKIFRPVKAYRSVAAHAYAMDEMEKPENDHLDFFVYSTELENF